MNKDDILAKSRQENKEKDLYEKEVQTRAGNIGAIAAMILATIFFVIQMVLGEGLNFGLYAVMFSVPAVGYIYKSIQMKRRRDTVAAIIYVIGTALFSAAHIFGLITSSTIM